MIGGQLDPRHSLLLFRYIVFQGIGILMSLSEDISNESLPMSHQPVFVLASFAYQFKRNLQTKSCHSVLM